MTELGDLEPIFFRYDRISERILSSANVDYVNKITSTRMLVKLGSGVNLVRISSIAGNLEIYDFILECLEVCQQR